MIADGSMWLIAIMVQECWPVTAKYATDRLVVIAMNHYFWLYFHSMDLFCIRPYL